MNFYVEALQDEHKLLESVLDSYRNQLGGAVAKAFEALPLRKPADVLWHGVFLLCGAERNCAAQCRGHSRDGAQLLRVAPLQFGRH